MTPFILRRLALFVVVLFLPHTGWSMSISPGLFLLQGITPGQPVDLAAVAGFHFTVPNAQPQETTYNIASANPIEGGMLSWEVGYEAIPDPSWCKLDQRVFTVPANGAAQIGLTIDIPDKPELYNRRFVVAIVLRPGSDPGIGVGLALAARIMIETAPDPVRGGNALGTIPSTLTVTGVPGALVSATTRVLNRTGAEQRLHQAVIADLVADPTKHPRFASQGSRFVATPSWLVPGFKEVVLADATEALYTVEARIPATAEPGQRYEDLAFLTTTGTAEVPAVVTFVRLQVEVEAPAGVLSATPEPAAAPAPPAEPSPAP